MLTKDFLKANEALKGLTDEQIAVIAKLSENDEDSVISEKTRTFHERYEDTIFQQTGIKKEGSEKSYQYFERAVKAVKGDTSTLTAQIETLKTEKQDLEAKLKSAPGDETLKAQIAKLETELTDTKKHYTEATTKVQEVEAAKLKEVHSARVTAELAFAEKALKIKTSIPEASAKTLVELARKKVSEMPSEYDEKGRLVFKDENGAILKNPTKNLEPFTVDDLLGKELTLLGVIDTNNKPAGAGGSGGSGGSGGGSSLDLSTHTSQVSAMSAISKHLATQGLVKGTEEYQKAQSEIFTENKINELPEQ